MSVIAAIIRTCDEIDDGRTLEESFNYLGEEVTELRVEIEADSPGEDGVFGEVIDVLINCVDIIRHERMDATPEEIEREVERYAQKRCLKWLTKAGFAS